MRVWWWLGLVACTAPRPSAPLAHRSQSERIVIAPDDARWVTIGSAEQRPGELRLHYCCVASGIAKRALPELVRPGRWTIAIAHANTECTRGAYAFVEPPTPPGRVAYALAQLAADAHGGTTELAIDVDVDGYEHGPFELALLTDGGYSCCGTTRILSVALERRD